MFELVVTAPFEHYVVGQRISDSAEIARVAIEHMRSVVRVQAAPKPVAPKRTKSE